ncbi:MAG: hypothetical protein ABI977_10305, partial [Acidobacteriota bacterium]
LFFLTRRPPMPILAALLLQSERPDLTLNYFIIASLLVLAAVLSVVVVRRRMKEKDDDWD